jgi:lipopolysaccharide/colanic/teichoic acid biosynthesis glycosyltransferase
MLPLRKRALDLILIFLCLPGIVFVLGICAFSIRVLEGRPVFYVSMRRVCAQNSLRMVKFRTMRRDAERIANRDTVPVTSTRFLNISATSPLYTPVGRIIERLMLTELPQIWHVVQGKMTLVGNRPLPSNVIAALRTEHPDVEDRFLTPGGLTGPVQLVGREAISDADRLLLEAAYCRLVSESYTARLDFLILFHTIVIGLMPSHRFTPEQVVALMARATNRYFRVRQIAPEVPSAGDRHLQTDARTHNKAA